MIDIKSVVEQYGLDTDEIGTKVVEESGWYKAICPFHTDTEPSLKFKEGDTTAKCFSGCGQKNSRQILKALNTEEKHGLSEDFMEEILTGIDNSLLPNIEKFAALKGLDLEFLKSQGFRNATHDDDFSKGIVIPFTSYDGEHQTYKIRVKYRGKDKYRYDPKGQNKKLIFAVNKLRSFYDKSKTLYMCEGETDALTLIQLGFQAIGICGASAWSSDFESKYLEGYTDKVLVMDNDKAGRGLALEMKDVDMDVLLVPAGKDINQYYCEVCNKDNVKFLSDLSGFPRYTLRQDRYIEKLKQDKRYLKDKKALEFLMVAGYDAVDVSDLKKEIQTATGYDKSTVKTMVGKAVGQLEKMEEEYSQDIDGITVEIEDGRYIKKIRTLNKYADIPLTSFVITVDNIMLEDAGVMQSDNRIYFAKITNTNAETAQLMLTADDLSNQGRFEKACIGKGHYKMWLKGTDFAMLRDKITEQRAEVVKKSSKVGYIDGKWLFGNCGITQKGEVVESKDGMVNLGDMKYIVDIQEEEPVFDTTVTLLSETREDLVEDLKTCWGSYDTWTMLGWHTATLFSHEIFDAYKVFPINFLTGIRNSGKTALGRIVNRWFGFNEDEKLMDTTQYSMRIMLDERVSLPVFMDEYNPEQKESKEKNTILKGIGYRAKKSSGRKDGGLNIYKVNGTLLLAGQTMPTVSAILDRCTISRYSEYTRELSDIKQQKDLIERIESSIDQHKALTLDICKKVLQPKEVKKILTEIDEFQKILIKENISHRIYKNVSILAGSFMYMYKDIVPQKEQESYIQHVIQVCKTQTIDVSDTDTVGSFFENVSMLVNSQEFEVEAIESRSIIHPAHFVVSEKILYMRLPEIVNIYQKSAKTVGVEVSEYKTVSKDIEQEPFFIKDSHKKGKRFGKDYGVDLAKYYAIDLEGLKDKSESAYHKFMKFNNLTKNKFKGNDEDEVDTKYREINAKKDNEPEF